MKREITIKPILDKSEFDSMDGYLKIKRPFVGVYGKDKIGYFQVSNLFLSVNHENRISHLVERAVNELIPKFEIDNMYFFEIDDHTLFEQLEEKPDWANIIVCCNRKIMERENLYADNF